MKRYEVALALVTAVCVTVPVSAEEDAPRGKRGAAIRQRIIKRFDENGDGKLDKAEWAKATAAMKRGRGGDGNGQTRRKGQGNRPASGFQGRIPEAVLKRFDKDGDGKLNEAERQAARKAREQFQKRNTGRDGAGNKRRPGTDKRPGTNAARRPGQNPFNRPEFIKRFDKDGDGKLSDAERSAARAMFAARGGPGGGGDPIVKPKPRLKSDDLLDKFDVDGNGELNSAERAAALTALQAKDA